MFRAMRHIWYKPARFLWLVLTFKADVAAWCFDSRGKRAQASNLFERFAEVKPILGKDSARREQSIKLV